MECLNHKLLIYILIYSFVCVKFFNKKKGAAEIAAYRGYS